MYVFYALKLKLRLRSNPVSKSFFISQIGHRPRASNSKRGLKKKQGRIMTILGLQYDADAKKAVPETY